MKLKRIFSKLGTSEDWEEEKLPENLFLHDIRNKDGDIPWYREKFKKWLHMDLDIFAKYSQPKNEIELLNIEVPIIFTKYFTEMTSRRHYSLGR